MDAYTYLCMYLYFRLREPSLVLSIRYRAAMKPAATYARTPCLMDHEIYIKMIKDNIKDEDNPVQNPMLWVGKVYDEFMTNYAQFFEAAARTGKLLSVESLKKALRNQFQGDAKVLHDFAKQVCEAHSRCKHGSKNVVCGGMLAPAVRNVSMIWKCEIKRTSSSSSCSTFRSEALHASQDVENEIDDKEDDDHGLQESKSALANTVAMWQTSTSSNKSLKRNVSCQSIGSSCCSDADAPAGAKKQPVKVV